MSLNQNFYSLKNHQNYQIQLELLNFYKIKTEDKNIVIAEALLNTVVKDCSIKNFKKIQIKKKDKI